MLSLGDIQALIEAKEFAQASWFTGEALNQSPDDWKLLVVAASAYIGLDQHGTARALLKRADQLCPNNTAILNNIGMCELGCTRYEDAVTVLTRALKIDPKNANAMNNICLAYVQLCDPRQAIQWGAKALAIRGEDPALLECLGYANLMLRNWQDGWRCFEGGLHGKFRSPRRYQNEPYWDGSRVGTLVVRGEQGVGDEISFASVIPEAKARCDRLVVECDARLHGLFTRSFPDIEWHGTRYKKDELPWVPDYKIDAHALSGSLCQYFRNSDSDFSGKPYLVADPERVIQWKALLSSLGPRRKIGIAWKGGSHGTHRERRSTDLEAFLPLLRQDADFISLEYKDPASEIEGLKAKHGITVHHWPRASQAHDIDDVAALVESLDLVITVQTAVVHVAGALGKPCCVMVPRKPHWRYHLEGDSLPWYSSVRLYRQTKDWATVINKIAEDLRKPSGT